MLRNDSHASVSASPAVGMPGARASQLTSLIDQVSTIIVGKREQVSLSVICLLASGHLLVEDVPGVGKTTLSQALARSLGLSAARVQFTADLLPSDLIGVSIYERQKEAFVFHPGPVFAQVLLADEINRAGPRTQSALLEAMEERQVSVGYPDAVAERSLLAGSDRRLALQTLQPVMTPESWLACQSQVDSVHVADSLLDYVLALIHATRDGRWFAQGLSPRAGLSLLRLARARALVMGRQHVSPEDIQVLWVPGVAHRLQPLNQSGRSAAAQARALL